jgi:hypothetical protein
MTGRRGKNLRSGDLKEELGVLLLKGVCVVATVERPEDVGLDGIATLLREQNGLLYAEDTFYIQFKSDSIRAIRYKGEEVTWLKNLKLPLFIGSVSIKDASIKLYCTHRLNSILAEMPHTIIQLNLDPTPDSDAPKEERYAYIGPPVLSWTIQDMSRDDFAEWSYERLKPLLVAEQMNVDTRPLRLTELIKWTTNEVPLIGQGTMQCSHPSDIPSILRSMNPHMVSLMSQAIIAKDRQLCEVLSPMLCYMKNNGFDPDPHNLFYRMVDAMEELRKLQTPAPSKDDQSESGGEER